MKRKRNFTVTLLVSTYNRPEALEAVLYSVLRQTVLPTEIVVADDGSDEETERLIARIAEQAPIPIMRVWHPDTGFRLGEIRNKAIAAAKGEYIIQIDGDVLLERHFIADHINVAKRGAFVCGSRTLLTAEQTARVLRTGINRRTAWSSELTHVLNNLRIGWLRRYLAPRFGRNQPDRLRGCNMAFWKRDLMTVNGYNEEIAGWGGEDIEIAWRLMNSGIQKRMLKFGGVMYHLYHPLASKSAVEAHSQLIDRIRREGIARCEKGLDQYL